MVTIRSFSVAHIDSLIMDRARNWLFTGLYGNSVLA